MYCPECGEEVDDGSAFCRVCGSNLRTGGEDGRGGDGGTGPESIRGEPIEDSDTDTDTDHPIVETWLGVVLLWSAFVAPPVPALIFAAAGIGSFPPVRRWVASTVGDVPYFVEVAVAVIYMFAFLVALGFVWWTAYQGPPTAGRATLIAILMLGIMGVIAAVPVVLVSWYRS
jgi:hypothetical protein